MDDLTGLDWSASSASKNNLPPKASSTAGPAFSYPSLRPTPSPSGSGRSTPLNLQLTNSGTAQRAQKSSTPANDSFSNLIAPRSSTAATNNLSLLDRQRQLQEEKARKEAEERKKFDSHFGVQDSQWASLGSQNGSNVSSRVATPVSIAPPKPVPSSLSKTINAPFAGLGNDAKASTAKTVGKDDILAAFNASAPVDRSSHFPPPASRGSTPLSQLQAQKPTNTKADPYAFNDDDDPFGLNELSTKPSAGATAPTAAGGDGDGDDILGMLGKPVSELPPPKPKAAEPQRRRQRSESPRPAESMNPQAKAVAELVDMGFPADQAAIALAQTESGTNVQAAVGILLNQAHEQSRQKAQSRPGRETPVEGQNGRGRTPGQRDGDGPVPSWMREQDARESSGSRRREAPSGGAEKDVAQIASELGSTLFKSANSLWKQGQKKVQKAVAEFSTDADPSQPKWMRDAQIQEAAARQKGKAAPPNITDEAAMLEGRDRPQGQSRQRNSSPPRNNKIPDRSARQPPASAPAPKPSARRERFEDDIDLAVASSRRRRPPPTEQAAPANMLDFDTPPSTANNRAAPPPAASRNPFTSHPPSQRQTPTPKPAPARPAAPPKPKAPPRQIPPMDASALAQSAKHRALGTSSFKRGDYAAAHESYTSALRPLPPTHPVIIVVLCNRALTALKTGDAKVAVADAETALKVIGPSNGEGEKIDLGGAEGQKEMREFFGKALMRKAEGLEHLERWADAGKVWKEAVEANVGGAVAIQGRNRCDKASGNVAAPSAASKPATPRPQQQQARRQPPKPTQSALSALSGDSNGPAAGDSTAVRKLRAQHAAQSAEDDEKFALTDSVSAKLTAWKGTKSDNLRALLGSLDTVLWADSGWAKVSMGDLVLPNRVKVIYMKAIAKVHPDKISQTATTEQRMLAASVFATLNEAWDKFKTENGL